MKSTTLNSNVDPQDVERGRLGWRINEWVVKTGTSRPTVWRQVKRGDLRLIYIGRTPIVPRSEAIRLGLIAE